MAAPNQWIRKIGLVVTQGAVTSSAFNGVDLSDCRIKFHVRQVDYETPNNVEIRIYNLSPDQVANITQNMTQVYLQAGYRQGAFGNIFTGQIKQFRKGKEDAVTTYL